MGGSSRGETGVSQVHVGAGMAGTCAGVFSSGSPNIDDGTEMNRLLSI